MVLKAEVTEDVELVVPLLYGAVVVGTMVELYDEVVTVEFEVTIEDSEVLGAGVGDGTRSVLIHEQADEIRSGFPSQLVIGSGNPVVAVFTEIV